MILRDTDIDSALSARARQRTLIEGRGPRVAEFLLNPYRFGGGGGGGSDPDFSSVSALLHMNGTNGGTSFPDVKGNAWTAAGSATTSTGYAFFSGSSGRFVATASRISTPHFAGADLSTGDFTIEFLARLVTSSTFRVFVVKGPSTIFPSYLIQTSGTGRINFAMGNSAGSAFVVNLTGTTALATATDYFISARRSGNMFSIAVNGSVEASTTYTGALRSSATDVLSVGAYPAGTDGVDAYMAELRITKGVARSTITAPTAPFPNS